VRSALRAVPQEPATNFLVLGTDSRISAG